MIIVDRGDVIVFACQGHCVYIDKRPHVCTRCFVMHYWFINRESESLCAECDGDQQRAAAATVGDARRN